MTRIRKILVLAGLSSGYLLAGTCTMSGDGWSFLPTIPNPLAGLIPANLLPF